ncbi:response regulator receiver domain-containing protein [Mucilaginibacter oryzae]|uniref:Response regulator receiver domain-containing protein n=1 Tax=Mucilaginibacter oryzae TaxID=468058 RepID=A0A316GYA8_9SPHI|nr:response regulator [Mucilaginibacter oryzae]PWK68306.1 response regulator receiver domain-containing protein [Mucilaginibacter oryzae]
MRVFLLDDDESLISDFKNLAKKITIIAGKPTTVDVLASRDLASSRQMLFGKNGEKNELKTIKLCLIDYYLDKGESGITLIEEIRKKNKKIPIVLLTGYDNSKNAFEAGELGATTFSLKDDLLLKHDLFNAENLKLLIEQVLTKSKLV